MTEEVRETTPHNDPILTREAARNRIPPTQGSDDVAPTKPESQDASGGDGATGDQS